MLNDRSTTLDLLLTRRSGHPRDMVAPGPSPAELDTLIEIAARVPDHGKIAPWRFVVIQDRAAFAGVLEAALDAEQAGVDPRDREDARRFAAMAPTLVAVLSVPDRTHKVPVWEQELSAGVATYNLQLAAHAMGYVTKWLTGWAAYSPHVYAALGGEPGGRVAAFLFIGTPTREQDERARPALAEVARVWPTAA